MYGVLASISLAGLAFSLFGGASDLIGTVIIAIANSLAVSMVLKEHCPRHSATVSSPAVAESEVDIT
jgi:hypothetical protein|tara:strand:- start:426 stop:626 length:201 start_codon:yes stop_codon:yes gene_type:complete